MWYVSVNVNVSSNNTNDSINHDLDSIFANESVSGVCLSGNEVERAIVCARANANSITQLCKSASSRQK